MIPIILDIKRTDGIVIIQITLAPGRTVEQKKALYKTIAEFLAAEQKCANRRCLHQPNRSTTRELVLRKWSRPIRRRAAAPFGKVIIDSSPKSKPAIHATRSTR
jgi:hypothetical protein